MKRYVRPMMDAQMFVANEYVAACWGVGCMVDEANNIEHKFNNHPYGGHRQSKCGQSSHQYIYTNAQNKAIGMEEQNTFWGTLVCTIFTDKSYNTKASEQFIKEIDPGETIYWTTEKSGNLYHHVGKVQASNPSNPNASN